MGGTIQYVYRDGQRLTAWMLYVLILLDAELWRRFRVRLRVISAIRTYEEQKRIFLARYVRYADINGRRVYDTRWWNGQRWYRISDAGTVAAPGSSNHEIQGTAAAVDIQDTGADAGITSATSTRGRWIRQWCRDRGLMIAEGDSFREGWHFKIPGIFRTPPAIPTATPKPVPTPAPAPVPEEDEDDMKPTVHARLASDGTTEDEWMLGHPEFGRDLPVFEGAVTDQNSRLSAAGAIKVFRGFMVTMDRDIAAAWARVYAKGVGEITSRTDRAGYIQIQKQLSRVADELS